MENKKGITLVSLVITIIVLIILASIGVSSGIGTIRYANFNKAKSEMELMQTTVNKWYDEYNNLKTDNQKSKNQKQIDYISEHGFIINDNSCDETVLTKTVQATNITKENFRFLSKTYLKNNLGLDTDYEFLVNIPERKLILFGGIDYDNKTYYTIEDFGISSVESAELVKSITFKLEKNDEQKEIIVKNLVFKDNNDNQVDISKFTVEYCVSGTNNWNNANNKLIKFEEDGNIKYKFTVNEPNYYDVRVSTTDKKYISDLYTVRITALTFAEKEIDFTGDHMVDTGIKLFSEENRNKDFIIRFTIDEFGDNKEYDTLINAKREDNTSLYPGFTFRCSAANKYQFSLNVNSNTKPSFTYTADQLLHKETTISKIDNVVYIQAAGGAREMVIDLKNVNTTQFYSELADTVLTLGTAFINGESDRFFTGKVSDVVIQVFDHVDTIKREREVYVAKENLVFDKTESKVLIFDGEHKVPDGENKLPEVRLFTAENINKDFEIKIKVESFGDNSYKQQDTIISTKQEIDGSPTVVPGFVFRRTSKTAFEIKGNKNAYSNTDNKTMLGKTVIIKRTDGVYTAQIDDQTPKNFTTVATQDNTTPLVIGGIIYTSGEIDRMVNCTVSELSIKIYDEVQIE